MNLLANINPVTRILGLALLTTPLMFTVDWVSATVVLAFTLLMVPLCGLGYGRFFKRAVAILIVAPLAGIPMALYGQAGGETYLNWGLIHVTELSVSLAGAMVLRVLAIALPVVLLSADVDPTDLGDGLSQVLRLPERFVIGTVAALRMLTLLRDDLDAMRRSRRARGIADQGKIKYWFTLSFGLLVMSLRRAGKLATAMEARGFGGPTKRSWARESKLRSRDWGVMVVCLGVALVALGIAWLTGDLRPVWSVR